MKYRTILTLSIILTFSAGISAETGDSLLTFLGVVDYARQNNLQLSTAKLSKRSAALDITSARSALYPTAQTSFSAGRQFTPVQQNTSGASVGAALDISPSRYMAYKAALAGGTSEEYSFKQQERDVVYNVMTQYIRTAGALKLIEVEQENVAYQNLKRDEIAAQVEQGAASRADLLQQQANCADAQVRLLQQMQNYERQRLQLVDNAGLSYGTSYTIDTTDVMRLVTLLTADSAELHFDSLAEKEEITAQRYQLEADKALLSSSKLGYVPSLSFSGNWSVDGGTADVEPSFRIGGSLTIPLLDRRQRWLQVKNAQIRLASDEVTLDKLKRSNDLSLSQAALDDALAVDKVQAAAASAAAAHEALLAMEERYRVGASTFAELKVVQSASLQAADNYVQARFDRTVSRLSVLYETGRIDYVITLLADGKNRE